MLERGKRHYNQPLQQISGWWCSALVFPCPWCTCWYHSLYRMLINATSFHIPHIVAFKMIIRSTLQNLPGWGTVVKYIGI